MALGIRWSVPKPREESAPPPREGICLFAASKGIAKIFNVENYRQVVVPVTLFIMAFSSVIFENTHEMLEWAKIYKYYAFPFQVILPLIIYIVAEIKHRTKSKEQKDLE